MNDDPLPEPDRAHGAPHPRETTVLFGQEAAEKAFLDAFNADRLPNSWLLTGPKGVGKATFAWRAARHLIAHPPQPSGGLFGGAPAAADTLDTDPDHPVSRRLRALSEPQLLLLRRAWDADRKRLKTQLTVDEVRGLKGFFQLSGGDGRRVVIVDAADEMNVAAANALLKELEEPPENAVIFLVSHQPSGLLPTIRSRCRTLRFAALGANDLTAALRGAGVEPVADMAALSALSGGSAGTAIQLIEQDGLALYERLVALLKGMPDMDRSEALKLSDAAGARGADAVFDLTLSLLDIALSRTARAGATGAPPTPIVAGEAEMFARLGGNQPAARQWAETAAALTARARRGQAVNLDPAALIFDMFLDLDRTAARLAASAA